MKYSIDYSRLRFVVLSLIVAVLASWFGQPFIHGNEQAINVIVTVFSVLAGFLVAIIAIVGDPALLPPGSWRAAELERDKFNFRLTRHKWLFLLYLITLGCVFITLLTKDDFPDLSAFLESVFLFFGIFAFLLSLRLPEALMKVQRERIDAVIEHRRIADGIPAGKEEE